MAGGRAGGRGGRDGRTDNLEDIYERDDVAQEARAEARFQQLEQSMTAAIAALADQVAALAVGGNPPRHQPYNRRPREEDESTDGEAAENLFAAGAFGVGRAGGGGFHQQRGRGREIMVENHDFRPWESGLKINFHEFQGGVTLEKILEVDAMDDATVVNWSFTQKIIPDPIVDWNKAPIFDEEQKKDIIVKEEIVQGSEKIAQSKAMVDLEPVGVNASFWCNEGLSSILVDYDGEHKTSIQGQFLDPFWEFLEDFASTKSRISCLTLEIASLFSEESSKSRFEKINLKYKTDADKERRIKFFHTTKTRGRVFFKPERMMQIRFWKTKQFISIYFIVSILVFC